jgi:hypothetical protein
MTRRLLPVLLALPFLAGLFAARPAGAADSTIRLSGKSGITISDKVIGAGAGTDAVVIRNCRDITLRRIKVRSGYRGFYIADSQGITLDGCEVVDARQQGFLTNNCRDLRFVGCVARRTKAQHGFYAGGRTQGARWERCEARDCGRAGIQVNSEGSGVAATGVVLTDCTVTGNSRGTHRADVNFLGVGSPASRFRITGCRIDSRKVGVTVAQWQGVKCNGDILGNTIRGKTKRVDITPGSMSIRWDGK